MHLTPGEGEGEGEGEGQGAGEGEVDRAGAVGLGAVGGGLGSSVRRRRWLHVDMAGPSTDKASGRGLHSSTFRLNVCAF